MFRWMLVGAGVALVAACGGGDDAETPETTAPPLAVEVDEDLVYHSGTAAEGWLPPLVDVYAPAGAEDLPVVVMLHGNPQAVDKSYLRGLATATAEQGAVVFVPNWGTTGMPPDAQEALAQNFRVADALACAVSYAVEKAAGYGGDPDELVIFGHSAGGNTGSVTGLRPATPLPGCAVDAVAFEPDALVFWEGDWLLASPVPWDSFGGDVSTLLPADTPWDWLDTPATKPSVVLAVSAGGVEDFTRCDATSTGGWYGSRDPDGRFVGLLEAIGAFDDGCIDIGEVSAILADALQEAGYDVDELALPDSDHEALSSGDMAALVDAVLAVAQGSP